MVIPGKAEMEVEVKFGQLSPPIGPLSHIVANHVPCGSHGWPLFHVSGTFLSPLFKLHCEQLIRAWHHVAHPCGYTIIFESMSS